MSNTESAAFYGAHALTYDGYYGRERKKTLSHVCVTNTRRTHAMKHTCSRGTTAYNAI